VKLSQAPETILMLRPANFGFNPLTAASNTFQQQIYDQSTDQIRSLAQMEFDQFVEKLVHADVDVIVVEDLPDPITPDAVFPNNWISFHQDGTVILYPMMAQNRRQERREDILLMLQKIYNFEISRILDFSIYEVSDRFLEGTGSMVLDYINKKAYANLSIRTDESILDRFCMEMGYQKVIFPSVDEDGMDIYHTNVVMCIGNGYVVVCLESIIDEADRINLMHSFESTDHEIVDISYHQLSCFAGNMMEVKDKHSDPVLIMSEKAYHSLGKEQLKRLKKRAQILYTPLDTIEKYGGGSARCMIAGVFLPKSEKS